MIKKFSSPKIKIWFPPSPPAGGFGEQARRPNGSFINHIDHS